MTGLTMTLYRETDATFHPGGDLGLMSGVYVTRGELNGSKAGTAAPLLAAPKPSAGSEWLRFTLHTGPAVDRPEVISSEAVTPPEGRFLARIDQVSFPAGAVAYRHTHAGAGLRYLTDGALTIVTDHGRKRMTPGAAWFEPADTPVRAEASQKAALTRFVRFMVVPLSFEGRSTFALVNPEDAALPRLQSTHRFFDHIVDPAQSG